MAALDAATGNATAWDPNASDWVNALAVSGTTVYAGGRFTTIGGAARRRFAAFGQQQHTLTVNRAGTGSGTVTSNPAGINCGADCTEAYASGTVVTLAAAPAAGSAFAGWSGDPDCSDGQVTMSADITCIATFNVAQQPQQAEPGVAPEASTLLLMGSGLAGLGAYARLRWRARKSE